MFIAFDLETYLIAGVESPKPVCVSWYGAVTWETVNGVVSTGDGTTPDFIIEKLFDEALQHEHTYLVGQNVKFDLGCIFWHYPHLRSKIFELLANGKIKDTYIREQLFDLSTTGRVSGKSYSLATLSKKYLGLDLSEWKEGDDIWRLRYNELDGIPTQMWPKEARDYALLDVEVTHRVATIQEQIFRPRGTGSAGTQDLQVKADFCLQLITQRGILLDSERVKGLEESVRGVLEPVQKKLLETGFAKYTKAKGKVEFRKKTKELKKHLINNYPDYLAASPLTTKRFKEKHGYSFEEALERYQTGKLPLPAVTDFYNTVKADNDSLLECPRDEVLDNWLTYTELEKIITTYIPRLKKSTKIYAPYRVLKETGRTSSFCDAKFPSINIQQIPREGGLRECFIPRSGYKFGIVDYCGIELACIAHNMKQLFGHSTMWTILNSGTEPVDMHAFVGHALFNGENLDISFEQFKELKQIDNDIYKKYRNRGKPIGLGYFGGLGEETMCTVSKGQGIPLTFEQAQEGRKLHGQLFPEIIDYLGWRRCRDGDNHPRNGEEGWVRKQQYKFGRQGYAYDCNGRYRSGCTYCSCANGKSMQSPAADGLKEALFRCVRACEDPNYLGGQLNDCFVLFEIHDEIGFEIPDTPLAQTKLTFFADLMVASMQEASIPSVRVAVEGGLMDRWSKDESTHTDTIKRWRDRIDVPCVNTISA